jgi:hypothetical protein
MLKIITSHNKQDVTYTFTIGQNFPQIEGKLLSVELSGKELEKFLEVREVPVNEMKCATWCNEYAGRVLKLLREIL